MRALSISLLLIAFACSGARSVWASDASVRISFLLNFSRFTEWPDSGLALDTPMTFCIAPGDPEMSSAFTALQRQTLRNRPVSAIHVARPADAVRCNVLYLPTEVPGGSAPWLASVERAGTLTVSDRPDFTEEGGVIGLIMVAGRYRFDVNLGSAKRRNLSLSADLLKLARSVK